MNKFMGWIFVPLLLRTSSCDYMANISVNCDFEYGLCGWRNSNDNRNSYWTRKKHNGDYFLYLDKKSTATLESSNIHMDDFQCLTFWYDMSNEDAGTIQVSLEENGTRHELNHFKKSNDKGNSWTQAIVEIEGIRKRNVKILLRGQSRSYFGIKLDNISLTSGSCLDCRIEQQEDFCNWDGHSIWNRPQKGLYSTSSTLPRNQSILTSKSYIYPGEKCLSFKYSASNICTTFIQVLTDNGVVLSNISNIPESKWIQTSVSICLFMMSRIVFSFVHGRNDCGKVGVGHIFLKQGLCSETTTAYKDIMSGCKYATNTTTNIATNTAATTTNIIRTDVTGSSSTVTIAIPSAVTMIDTTVNHTVQETTSRSKESLSGCTYVTNTTSNTATNTAAATTIIIPTNVTGNGSTNMTITIPSAVTMIDSTLNDTVQEHAIMATAIGCLVMIIAVLLVAVCYYRRRYSNSVPNASTTNTGLYEPHVVVSSQDNYAQIISLSSESENNMSDSVNYNPEPEYFTIAE